MSVASCCYGGILRPAPVAATAFQPKDLHEWVRAIREKAAFFKMAPHMISKIQGKTIDGCHYIVIPTPDGAFQPLSSDGRTI